MKICYQMLNDINFEPSHISPCCNTRNLRVPTFPYTGGPIDGEAYASHINKVLAEIQGGSNLCAGCPDLVETGQSSLSCDLKFRAVSFNQHRHFCNCQCVYCNLWNKRQTGKPYDPLPALQSLAEQDLLTPSCQIHWGGGESSILPTFDAACDWALGRGYHQFIFSSALRFSPAIARALKRDKANLDISLDSSSPAGYRKVKGLDGFRKVTENLRRYAQYNPQRIVLKYIIFNENNDLREIEGFLRICAGLKIGYAQFSLDFREVNAGTVSEKTLLAAAWMKIKALELGVPCAPAFIDEPWLGRINSLAEGA